MLTVSEVLSAKSARSLADQINHNCIIDSIDYHKEYGIVFRLYKFTTKEYINLDVESPDSLQIVLSQGRGYQRFYVDSRVLWNLRGTVLRAIKTALRILPITIETDNLEVLASGVAQAMKADCGDNHWETAFTNEFLNREWPPTQDDEALRLRFKAEVEEEMALVID